MKKKASKPDPDLLKSGNEAKNDFPGYPSYPEEEDIYKKFKKEKDVDPEDISHRKDDVQKGTFGKMNEKGVEDGLLNSDLDIPGSELDDDQEIMGSEDEENDYYSLGGDDHNDLEENNS